MNNRGYVSYARLQALKDITNWIIDDCGHQDSWLIGCNYITASYMRGDLCREITRLNRELGI
jgi:hypothetical protein